MPTNSPCPDRSRLEALLDGDLSAEEQASLESHLKTCEICRAKLDALTGQVGLLSDSGRREISEEQEPSSDAALRGAMSHLKAAGPHSEVDSAEMPTAAEHPGVEGISLDFLDPPTQAHCLGQLGEYEITGVVGHGGMGVVLKGRDPALNRYVAIKVLSPQLASSAVAGNRFMREAQMAAAVSHDHVVTIHAVAKARELPFLVMEYVAGVSLEERIRRTGPLKVEEILRIGTQAASGLAAAHAQGLVHRDIKPSNILLENGVERVKITDFGLARVVHEAKITQTGVVAGTPEYMSPEQARGEEIDRRSDLFSLGCVMYAMCTGRSPFRATTVTGAIHRVCEDTPRPIQEMNPEIPDWLTEIIDRLLTKKPEERFQTAGEVAEELGEYLALVQQPSRVRLPSSSVAPKRTRSEKLGSRGQRILAVAGMVCVGLALLAVFGWAKIMGRSPYFTMPPAPEGYSFVCLGDGANMPLSDGTDTPLNNLSELSTGVQTFANVPFFISDEYIRLNGYKAGVFDAFPPEVKALPVDRRAKRVHFFHGLQGGGDKGLTVAQYTVHYNDGTDQTIPIVTGEDIWDWWEATMRWPVTKAYSAWTGNNPAQRLAQKRSKEPLRLTLYRTEWKNPYPEKTIRSIDFIRTGDASPFCVAITCQDSDDDPIPPVAPAPEPAKITRVVAVENVWAAPNLTVLPDGTITMVIFNQSWFEDTEGDVECWASTDGLQWEKRGQVTQHDTETTRFNVAAGLANNGDLLVACSGRAKEQQPRQPNRAAFCGKVLRLWICRSADGGRTWESTKEFPAPEAGCMEYCPFGDIVRASDGSLRMSCYHVRWGRAGTDAATSGPRSWMFRSDDDGSSWQRVSMIGPQHYETFVFHLDETKWLAVARCDATDLFHSDDDGQTWHRPQRVTGPGEYHAHLLKLRDGRLLLTYNNRIPKQTGALARLSADEGKTWTSPIRLATSETWDCGYPSSIQRPDGKIVTAYYSGAAPECGHRHVGVALWDAPKLVSDDRR